MSLLSLFTRKGRCKRRVMKLIRGKKEVEVNVRTVLICLNGLKAVAFDQKKISDVQDIRIGLYFEPDILLKEFEKATDLIINEESPERRRYGPPMHRSTLSNWLWSSDGKRIDWELYILELINTAEKFLRLLDDQYEISGKAVAGYRLEQMYYPLCDIISLTEAFYAE